MFAQAATSPEVVWSLLWPLLFLSIGGVLLVTVTSVVPALRRPGMPAALTILIGGAAFVSTIPVWRRVVDTEGPTTVIAGAMSVDAFTVVMTAIIAASVVMTALVLDDYLRREGLDGPEWYVLLLMSASGGVLMAAADDLIVLFMGLEILSIAVYVLAALHLRRTDSQEAGFKYFVLGAFSSALFLYGIALIYGATGTTQIDQIAANLFRTNEAGFTPIEDASLLLAGMALLLVGFAFKVSAVPFHVWTPDVYQGAPTPITGFMASAVKVAGFAGLARVFVISFAELSEGGDLIQDDWRPMLAILAGLSLVLGAFMAAGQSDVKRMLAYSSIVHAGFLLIGVHPAGHGDAGVADAGGRALVFYLITYAAMVVGSFAVATVVSGRGDNDHSVDAYRGLARKHPALALMMAVLLFSQAGIPFTSGFMAKFRVLGAAVDGEAYVLAGVAMLAAVVAALLYLRIIVAMFLDGADDEGGDDQVAGSVRSIDVPVGAAITIVLAVIVTIGLGVLPDLGRGVVAAAADVLVSR